MQVLYARCYALDVHKDTVVACLRLVIDDKVVKETRTFETTIISLMMLSDWLADNKCTHTLSRSRPKSPDPGGTCFFVASTPMRSGRLAFRLRI